MSTPAAPTVPPAIAAEAVHGLFVLLKGAAVYGRNDEGYAKLATAAREALEKAHAEAGALLFETRGDRLYFNTRAIRFQAGHYAAGRFLIAEMRRRGVGAVEISRGCTPGELDAFIYAFKAAGLKPQEGFARLQNRLCSEGVVGITVRPYAAAPDEEQEPADPAQRARGAFAQAMALVDDVMSRARAGEPVDFARSKRVAQELADRVIADEQEMFELAAVHDFDDYTCAHSVNVSVYSIAIGVRLGLDRAQLGDLGFGGLFHDVGKARLSAGRIGAPGGLDEAASDFMHGHPALGAKVLLGMRGEHGRTLSRAVSIVFEHHRGADGSGYPTLALPRRQDLFSRIVAVADTFDALSSGRVDRKTPVGPDEALLWMIQLAGARLDAFLLSLFIDAVGILPIGTLVLLDTGELGVVGRNDPADPQRPQVRVFADRQGRKAAAEIVDLARRDRATGKPLRSVARVLDAHKLGVDVQSYIGSP